MFTYYFPPLAPVTSSSFTTRRNEEWEG